MMETDASPAAPYVARTLSYQNAKDERVFVEDGAITDWPTPVVLLGEPGMGKTRLLEALSDSPDWVFRSARAFVDHPDPRQLVAAGQGLIIDGLDELSAASEADPIYRVLGKLIAAGTPPFILSCRAADWRGAVARPDIEREYQGMAPTEMRIEPLDRTCATAFLTCTIDPEHADEIIAYLDDKGLRDLYGNPLTLMLFAEVAAAGTTLPETRAELMRQACALMWHERSDRHDGSAPAKLDEQSALRAAGLASTALILTGAEALSFAPSRAGQIGLLSGAELQRFAGGTDVRTMMGSRLFTPVPGRTDLFRPVHRTIAEYLGARWLAGAAQDDQARARVLAMLTIDEGVPASLRGLHAWLASDAHFASAVIDTDPYGVLRYGDADGLAEVNARRLLHALRRLEEANPYFRAEDWGQHSAKSLGQLALLDDVRALLVAPDTGFHLRTLLLGTVRGHPIASALADVLAIIVLDEEGRYHFSERYDAVKAVIRLDRSVLDWPATFDRLIVQGSEDSTRLALETMDDLGFEAVAPHQIARAVLAHLGLLDDVEAEERDHHAIGTLHLASRHMPDPVIGAVLDAVAILHPGRDADADYRTRSELSDFVSHLIARFVEREDPDPARLMTWLRITPGRQGYAHDSRQEIAAYLMKADTVRHAIQHEIIFHDREHERLWSRMWRLGELSPPLHIGADDVVHFLNLLAARPALDENELAIWRELAEFAPRTADGRNAVLDAAAPVAKGHADRTAFLKQLRKPPKLASWEIEDRKRRRDRERSRDKAWTKHRADFSAHEDEVRQGELRWMYPVAQAYLALFRDTDRELAPADRVGQWLGPELQIAAVAGLDAVLFRDDLPSVDAVAESYAESKRWNFIYPMIAGIVERVQTGRSLADVPLEVLIAVRIGLHNEHLNERVHGEDVQVAIDAALRADPAVYERYIRRLLEPSFEKRRTHISGLYSFARTEADKMLARRLAAEWLGRFDRLPAEVELELIDLLAFGGDFATLTNIGRSRAQAGFADEIRRWQWRAVGLLTDFPAMASDIGMLGADDRDFLWSLRHRLQGSRMEERPFTELAPEILAWMFEQFRPHWPRAERPNTVTMGDQNAWDASDFLAVLINCLESDISPEAAQAMARLGEAPEDGYSVSVRYAAEQQRRARREVNFPGVSLDQLQDMIEARPPRTTDDLLIVVQHAIARFQRELRGSDTDVVNKYWRDNGQPRLEDECTDRLIEDLDRLLFPFGVGRAPQTDMPQGKRADITFSVGSAALPVECKGQWNPALWRAADEQLGALYLRDWRASGRGLYLVFWFGPDVDTAYRLKAPPDGAPRPQTADEARSLLLAHLPTARRSCISVEVLDLTR
ncbi:hypothetical protein SAMN05444678_105238 [Sphingomonas sp. YR710]|uniref:NACHT domain-containing protein n=1 Tax=Sphingomonas sp. YR710 TaxID=1882773 RepID=UPI00088CD706|nr:hypothetical protein [Sphingomonas sp. YR710]SDC78757.1 hypothetical protein SAMN05444678_105238 [Sphingomonas sp. YR710]